MCNDATCTLDVDPGTSVLLRGLAPTGAWFGGWTGPCGGNFDCELTADADVTVIADFSPTPNRVFVTSTTTDGAFGGIAGADAICAARATAGGLSGTFIAYLSDATTDAATRLNTSRGWVRTDGAVFADAPTAFVTGDNIFFPPRFDEFGTDLGDARVFSGTTFGVATADRCLEWTSNQGTDNGTISQTRYAYDSQSGYQGTCSTQAHLLCTETGRVQAISTRPDTGKLAFMSKNHWTPGGGRDSADAHCAAEATAAGLSGTFLAAIATTTESITSRFTAGELYRRIDGVRLLRSAGALNVDWLDVPPQLDQYGDTAVGDYWTGSARLDMPAASGADNCNDWTDATSTMTGYQFWSTNSNLTPNKTDDCDFPVALLCLEK